MNESDVYWTAITLMVAHSVGDRAAVDDLLSGLDGKELRGVADQLAAVPAMLARASVGWRLG